MVGVLCLLAICMGAPAGMSAMPSSVSVEPTPATAPEADITRDVTFTYLKSLPGERDNLRQFIVANWFAMDAVAAKRGLMLDYKLFDTGTDEGEWNLMVMVTYPDARGFDGIRDEWAKIVAAHRRVLVNGKGQSELGRVVRSQRLIERPVESHRP
jgi:hypothetical protein